MDTLLYTGPGGGSGGGSLTNAPVGRCGWGTDPGPVLDPIFFPTLFKTIFRFFRPKTFNPKSYLVYPGCHRHFSCMQPCICLRYSYIFVVNSTFSWQPFCEGMQRKPQVPRITLTYTEPVVGSLHHISELAHTRKHAHHVLKPGTPVQS